MRKYYVQAIPIRMFHFVASLLLNAILLRHSRFAMGWLLLTFMSFTLRPAMATLQNPDTLQLLEDMRFDMLSLQHELEDTRTKLDDCRAALTDARMEALQAAEAVPGEPRAEPDIAHRIAEEKALLEQELAEQQALHAGEVKKLNAKADNIMKAHADTKHEKQRLYDENIRLSEKLEALEKAAAHQDRENLFLQEENQRISRLISTLQEENEALTLENARAEQRATRFAQSREPWLKDSIRTSEEKERLSTEMQKLENQQDSDKKLMEELKRLVQEKDAALEETAADVTSLQEEVNQKNEEIQHLEKLLEKTMQALAQKEEELQLLEQAAVKANDVVQDP